MFWIIGFFVVVYGVCLPQYLHYKKTGKLALGCAYKSLGTLCAFTMALIAAIRLDPRCYICAGAILLYAAADYLLEFQFMLGAGFFLAGHILSVAFFFSFSCFSSSFRTLRPVPAPVRQKSCSGDPPGRQALLLRQERLSGDHRLPRRHSGGRPGGAR